MFFTYALLLCACYVGIANGAKVWKQENANDQRFLGIAWDAAASVVNQHKKTGRFMVPKKVLEARSRRGIIESIVLFQEAWCGPQDGNSLDDICESMCPLYQGGSEAFYEIRYDGNRIRASKIEDVQRVLKYINV
uniref:Secreted protein n=2 Tax=Angiostrongylus cantonensis TaxID=6313 RepID=A0A158P956_ANGCA